MSKSSYALAQKTRYRITLEISVSNTFDLNKIKWHKLLNLQSGESVKVEVEQYTSLHKDQNDFIVILDITALDDFEPHQIQWNTLIRNWLLGDNQKNAVKLTTKSYVEVIDAPYSW